MLSERRHVTVLALVLALALVAPAYGAGKTNGKDAAKPEPPVRVDIFEMLYGYEVAEIEHNKLLRHGPHWRWWKNDRIWTLVDGQPRTWLETDGKENFTFTITFKTPVKISKIVVGAGKTHRQERFQPFRWWLATNGTEEHRRIVLCTGEVRVEGEHTAWGTTGVPEKALTFGVEAINDDGTPAPEGQRSVHLTGVDLYGPEETAYVWASPAPELCFDKKFLPFVTTAGEGFDMRAWKISNAGNRTEDASGIAWSSSDEEIATVDSNGAVKALKPGEVTIRASLTPDIFDEVAVHVIPEEEGKVDLDLIWVERWIRDAEGNLVKRDWDAEVTDPQPGESLVWHAHVINVGEKTCKHAALFYSVDGAASSTAVPITDLPPAGPLVESTKKIGDVPLLRHTNERVVEFLEMPFDAKRHVIEVKVAATGDDEDTNPGNNTLTVWSDGIVFGYYMSETAYYGFGAIQRVGTGDDLPADFKVPYTGIEWGDDEWAIHSSTSYDRFQRIVRVFNRQFAMSKHPLTPEGITERINGEMFLISDAENTGATFGVNGHKFGQLNKTIDLIWGYVTGQGRSWAEFKYDRLQKRWRGGSYPYIDTPLIHEVSHARYLIDIYGSGICGRDIHVLNPDGTRAFPDDQMPCYDLFARIERHTPEQVEQAEKRPQTGYLRRTISGHGNMVGGMGYASGWCEHSAYAWERIRGRRARAGTWNASPPLGEFFNAIPDKNVVLIQTPEGKPCAGATIEVFQCKHDDWTKGIYAKVVDNEADITVTTDAEGKADLGPSPFATARPQHKYQNKGVYGYNGELNAVLRITYDGTTFYKFLTAFDANLGYWYKYGLEIQDWPYPTVKKDSELTYAYTVAPAWTADEEKAHRGEIPTTE